jgi:hypothetical protein
MTPKCIIAIDPGGSSGAIACLDLMYAYTNSATVQNMPETPELLHDYMETIVLLRGQEVQVVCENVGKSQPGNSARSASSFAVHRGHLEMLFVALKLPVIWVVPQKWMRELYAETYPKAGKQEQFELAAEYKKRQDAAKKDRKEFIYQSMKTRWPRVEFTKRQADALAILAWYQDCYLRGGQHSE